MLKCFPKLCVVLQSLSCRTFQNRSSRGRNVAAADESTVKASHIKTSAELAEQAAADAIMIQHRAMRGPTLADIHAGKSKEQVRNT
jgi:hypothetical protein